MKGIVHVFVGRFPSVDEACKYSQPQWEPEPPETVSDEEYEAWEANNPTHALADDLGQHLDEDFIETDEVDWDYLGTMTSPEDVATARANAPEEANVMVLVLDSAHEGIEAVFSDTPKLTLCGRFAFSPRGASL